MFSPEIKDSLPSYMQMHYRSISHDARRQGWFYHPTEVHHIFHPADKLQMDT